MKPARNTVLLYLTLGVLFLGLLVWQVIEHQRVRDRLRDALVVRSRDISSAVAVVLRSQRRFGGLISRSRLESALADLVQADELRVVALVNQAGEVVASAGEVGEISLENLPTQSARWDGARAKFFHLVDLGTGATNEDSRGGLAIVVDPPEDDGDRRGRMRDEMRRRPDRDNNGENPDRREEERRRFFRMERPPWMSEEEYDSMKEQRGVHGFLLEMSALGVNAAIAQDAWQRAIVVGFGALALVAAGFARRGRERSTEFEMRLVRAREQNLHLRDMNLAAAGLAHETRNPLNLIRGTAQMLARQEGVPEEAQRKCREIAGEVDRVTGQLNEFINYSRPREIRRTPVELGQVVEDVLRTVRDELDDQGITFVWDGGSLTVHADEKMLRQVVFNLIINSMQALKQGGRITIRERAEGNQEVMLEVCDDGPGVPPEDEPQIFQPYFTTRSGGSGLGLAIVRQIVLVHGWEITYHPNQPQGAVFRISKMEGAGTT